LYWVVNDESVSFKNIMVKVHSTFSQIRIYT
jgi:hypothetical protein